MESGKNHRRELGQLGEELACEWLREMGHTILERNWRSGHLEVDIISFDADGIHFIQWIEDAWVGISWHGSCGDGDLFICQSGSSSRKKFAK